MAQRVRRIAITLLAVGVARVSGADDVFLRGGGRLSGVVVERTKDKVVVETGPGLVTMPMSRVERIVESRSSLEAYQERVAALAPGDVPGWADLARWAAEHDLLTQSRRAWQRVLAADPSHPEANAALGRVQQDGAWMTSDEAYRARGYVEYAGRWVTPAEHEALLRERAAEEQAARERREATARAEQEEAWAREQRAAAQSADSGGIPLLFGGNGWSDGAVWGNGGYWGANGLWVNDGAWAGNGLWGGRGSWRGGHRDQGGRGGGSRPGGPGRLPTPAPQPTAQPSPPPPPKAKPGAVVVPRFPVPRKD
jgi:hypothetical protein